MNKKFYYFVSLFLLFIFQSSIVFAQTGPVYNSGGGLLNLRSAICTTSTAVTTAASGLKLYATAASGSCNGLSWVKVDVVGNHNASDGPAPSSLYCAYGSGYMQTTTGNYVTVTGISSALLVRASPGGNNLWVNYDYAAVENGQRFITTGGNQVYNGYTWYEIFVQNNVKSSIGGTSVVSGWVSGQYLIYSGCSTPGIPSIASPSSVASTGFTANWNSASGATSYSIDVSTNSSFSSFVSNNLNVGNTTSYAVSGLSNSTTYYYRVRANNSCGTSGNSGYSSCTTTTSCTNPPSAFTLSTPAGTDITTSSVKLTWTSSTNATSYDICYAANNCPASSNVYTSIPASATTYFFNNLSPNTLYKFLVVAKNASCSLTGNCVGATTLNGCTSATIATNPVNKTVTAPAPVTFTIAASGTAPSYQWQQSTNGGSAWANVPAVSPYIGGTTSALSINPTTSAMNNYQYRCVLSNACPSSVTSNPATLTVNFTNLNYLQVGTLQVYATNIPSSGDPRMISGNVYIVPNSCTSPDQVLHLSGNVMVSQSANSISGNDSIYCTGIGSHGQVNIYHGSYSLYASGSTLSAGIVALFQLAGLNLEVNSMQVQCNGIIINGNISLPDILTHINKTHVDLDLSAIALTASGVSVAGDFNIANLKLLNDLTLDSLNIDYNGIADDIDGYIRLETPAFNLDASVEIKQGKLDEISLGGAFVNNPVPIFSTGLAFDSIGGGVKNITIPPLDISLGARIVPEVPSAISSLANLRVRGDYKPGTYLGLSGAFSLFDVDVANAGIVAGPGLFGLSCDVDLYEVLTAHANLSVTNKTGAIKLRGIFNADLKTPELSSPWWFNDLFPPGVVLASTSNYLTNDYLAGTAQLLNTFDLYYYLSKNPSWSFQWSGNAEIIPTEAQNEISPNSKPSLNKGLYAPTNNQLYAFDLTTTTKDIIISGKGSATLPQLSVYEANGDTITATNYTQYRNVSYYPNAGNAVATFLIANPVLGKYFVSSNADSISIVKINQPPMIILNSVVNNAAGRQLIVQYTATDPDDNAHIAFGLDNDMENANGLIVADSIQENNNSGNILLNYAKIKTGIYYLYAVITDSIGQSNFVYYNNPIKIIADGAPNAPFGLSVTGTDSSLIFNFNKNNAVPLNYLIHYSNYPNTITLNSQNFSIGDTNQFEIANLPAGRYYEFAVTAIDTAGNESDLSNIASLTWIASAVNNSPTFDTSNIVRKAMLGNIYNCSLPASDPDGDPLIYSINGPSSAVINNAGLISWTPAAFDLGYRQFYVMVTDNKGGFDSLFFEILVYNAITGSPNVSFNKSGFYSYSEQAIISVTDPVIANEDNVSTVNMHVYSTSDATGLILTANKINPSTPVYTSVMNFTSGASSANSLHVVPGDTIWATYLSSMTGNTATNYAFYTVFKADFVSNDSICSSGSIQFQNTSKGNNLSFLWRFGDGATSSQKNPAHSFPAIAGNGSDNYNVKLIIKSTEGYSDSVTKTILIYRSPNITAGSNSPVCLGTNIQLSASGGGPYSWTGPNSFTSTQQNPTIDSIAPSNIGTFTVTVTGSNGCAATATTTVALNIASQVSNSCSPLITNGLVAYYPFCGNVNDASGNGKNGTVNGATLTTDRFGNANSAYHFNGSTDYVQLPFNQSNISKYSISAWFKTPDGGTILQGRGAGEVATTGIGITLSLPKPADVSNMPYHALFSADGGGYSVGKVTSNSYNDNSWHHIVGVWDGNSGSLIDTSNFKIYIDGVLVSQTGANSVGNGGSVGNQQAPITCIDNMKIGTHDGWNDPFFHGDLDDITIYNRALSQSEINLLYSTTSASSLLNNLISYWKFDEASGSALDAISSNTLIPDGGASHAAGKINNGANLVRSSHQSFSITDATQIGLDITGDISFSGWFKVNSIPPNGIGYTLLSKFNSSVNQVSYNFTYGQFGGVLQLTTEVSANGSSSSSFVVNYDLGTGAFHHIAMTWKASTSTATIYVDGTNVGSGTTGSITSIFNSSAPFSIGETDVNEPNNYFDGIIDEVGIWNRALTGAEVISLYNSGNGNQYPFNTPIPSLLTNLNSYWKLDGNSNDASGSNNGTNTAITFSSGNGKINQGAGFNGSTSLINYSAKVTPQGAVTVSFWMYITSYPSQRIIIYGNVDNGGVQWGINVGLSTTGKIEIEKANNTLNRNFIFYSNSSVSLSQWNFITFSWDGSISSNKAIIYINGVSDVTTTASTTSDSDPTNNLCIGQMSGVFLYPFTGNLDEIGVWSRALSPVEITSLYNNGYGLQYPFNPTINPVTTPTNFCAGASLTIPFTVYGSYACGNVFTAQLSDASGSFSSPTSIGTVTSTTSDTINAIIQSNTPSGTGYRIRVASSSPVINASDNGSNITINSLPVATANSNTPVCGGDSLKLAASGGTSYAWIGPNGFTSTLQNPSTPNVGSISAGSYTVTVSNTSQQSKIKVLVVGGGGAGGGTTYNASTCGGGGAGGYLYDATHVVTSRSYSVTVGKGGVGNSTVGANGGNSVFDIMTAVGGGGGGGDQGNTELVNGSNGGSGGGGAGTNVAVGSGGTASQGYAGGAGITNGAFLVASGGGGGAEAVGADASYTPTGGGVYTATGGVGGDGVTNPISGSTIGEYISGTYYVCGGGGGGTTGGSPIAGGKGGGGAGYFGADGGDATTPNTGAGGGGGSYVFKGGDGADGVVIMSYPTGSISATGGTITTAGGNTIHTFTSSGTFTVVSVASPAITCSASATTVVAVNTGSVTATNNSPLCEGGTVSLNASGGSSYSWSGPHGFSSTDQNPTIEIAAIADSGIYTVTVLNNNGCGTISVPTSVVVNANPATSAITPVNLNCNGDASGAITINTGLLGAAPPYSYLWSTGDTVPSVSGLSAGSITVNISDVNGCTTDTTFNITEPDILTSSFPDFSSYPGGYNVSCNRASNGYVNLYVSGGATPYSYSWNGGIYTTQNITNVPAANYTIVITDAHGCSHTDSTTLNEPAALSATVSSPMNAAGLNIGCKNEASGKIFTSISGGMPNYALNWTGPNGFTSSDPNVVKLAAGTYSVTVTDANGCTVSNAISLQASNSLVPLLSQASINGVNVHCYNGSDGLAYISSVSGGTAPFQYTWSNGVTDSVLQNVSSGTYSVHILDANGCALDQSVFLNQPDPILITASNSGSGCIGDTISLQATGEGGTGVLTYSWSGPNNFSSTIQNPNIAHAALSDNGAFFLTVSDDNGCTASANTVVSVISCPITVNLKMFIQGYYQHFGSTTPMDNGGGTHGGCLYASGVSSNKAEVDTITINLMDQNTHSQVGSSVKGILHTDGSVWQNGNKGVIFPGSMAGNSYYIKITHRNTVETWSASPVLLSSTTSYDFSTSSGKAYGNNMVKVDNIGDQYVYAFWSGDVYNSYNGIHYAQDGIIESGDYSLIEEDFVSILFGYYATDVTGDGIVESADYSMIEENYVIIIFKATPW